MYLRLLVFLSGACVMIIEIVAARFFAPFIGTSVAVWSAVIGTVMAGLSGGYALGGILGDRWRSLSRLRAVIAIAGTWTFLLIFLRVPVLQMLASTPGTLAGKAVLGSCVLLLVPGVLLGMVTPYAVRLVSSDIAHAGRIAGSLSALSTVGSIVGTFLAGFLLVPAAGTDAILAIVAAALLAAAAFSGTVRSAVLSLGVIAGIALLSRWYGQWITAAAAAEGILVMVDTPYSAVRVRALAQSPWGPDIRLLEIDGGSHGAIMPSDPHTLVFPYTRAYRLADTLRPDAESALLLGGGAYSVARDFLSRHAQAAIDVVEIDPIVTELARTYFGLRHDPRLRIHTEDARTFLRREHEVRSGSYAVVFGDVFRSRHTVPFHLTTVETARSIAALLDERGVYLLNVIASEEGKGQRFLASITQTLREVFPHVSVVKTSPGGLPTDAANFLVIASKIPLPDALTPVSDEALRGGMVLTDDYAPVEQMLQW